jgi:hypothetical protein
MLGRPVESSDTCVYGCGGLGCPNHPFERLPGQYMNAKLCTIKSGVPYSAVCYKDFPIAGTINVAGSWSTTWQSAGNLCSGTGTLTAFQNGTTITGRGGVRGSCIVSTAGPARAAVVPEAAALQEHHLLAQPEVGRPL